MDVLTYSIPWPPLLLAPFIGSFLGVLIQRLPEGRPVVMARSACDQCGHLLGPRDLMPLVSHALSGGRCRYCRAVIGLFPPAIELAALVVALWTTLVVTDAMLLWATCLLGWTLLTLAWIDVRTMILPDVLTLPLLMAGLIVTWLMASDALLEHVLGAVFGYLGLTAVAWGYRWLRGREGLGMGDARLLGAAGAWLGLSALPFVVLLAACLGLLAAGIALVAGTRVTAATAIPFGPFLALATWLAWLG